ncbi:unnamed protein product [Protopolystoma xenopodis]|uniref:Uncharacterized protein n=1 Tax=Protopolystoma xenopodis TaxID=117903 RepID=A0A448WC68_9PLAT|nr:unnamed protein product [Protopolystoma xenopodis]
MASLRDFNPLADHWFCSKPHLILLHAPTDLPSKTDGALSTSLLPINDIARPTSDCLAFSSPSIPSTSTPASSFLPPQNTLPTNITSTLDDSVTKPFQTTNSPISISATASFIATYPGVFPHINSPHLSIRPTHDSPPPPNNVLLPISNNPESHNPDCRVSRRQRSSRRTVDAAGGPGAGIPPLSSGNVSAGIDGISHAGDGGNQVSRARPSRERCSGETGSELRFHQRRHRRNRIELMVDGSNENQPPVGFRLGDNQFGVLPPGKEDIENQSPGKVYN